MQNQNHHFVGDWQQADWVSGIGLVSRWPMSPPQRRPLRADDGIGDGEAVHVTVDGERGPIQLFAVMLDYPLDGSAVRQPVDVPRHVVVPVVQPVHR